MTFFHRKEPDMDNIEVLHIADVEHAILREVKKITELSQVCSDIYDLSALFIHVATTRLLTCVSHKDFAFLQFYRNAAGGLVGIQGTLAAECSSYMHYTNNIVEAGTPRLSC